MQTRIFRINEHKSNSENRLDSEDSIQIDLTKNVPILMLLYQKLNGIISLKLNANKNNTSAQYYVANFFMIHH